uniref:Uncharacterized protein n=1 Tax=Timema douglasi TaxID=61478 RepID=A0A7R8VB49_TIMDO|nr:unnamed protein product [Timema douglasi]
MGRKVVLSQTERVREAPVHVIDDTQDGGRAHGSDKRSCRKHIAGTILLNKLCLPWVTRHDTGDQNLFSPPQEIKHNKNRYQALFKEIPVEVTTISYTHPLGHDPNAFHPPPPPPPANSSKEGKGGGGVSKMTQIMTQVPTNEVTPPSYTPRMGELQYPLSGVRRKHFKDYVKTK